MKNVFADSFYYIALLSDRDAEHDRAVKLASTLDAPMVTTEYVLIEVADALAGLRWRKLLPDFLATVRAAPEISIVPASTHLMNKGLALYAERSDKEWSLTDCVSFQVMRERRLTDAQTQDHHFEQAGFRILL